MEKVIREFIKFFVELLKMMVTMPKVILSIFEDRDPLDDNYVYQG